jgi:hypothetical protein
MRPLFDFESIFRRSAIDTTLRWHPIAPLRSAACSSNLNWTDISVFGYAPSMLAEPHPGFFCADASTFPLRHRKRVLGDSIADSPPHERRHGFVESATGFPGQLSDRPPNF